MGTKQLRNFNSMLVLFLCATVYGQEVQKTSSSSQVQQLDTKSMNSKTVTDVISYQGVATDASGNLIKDTEISIKFELVDDTDNSSLAIEDHIVTTDSQGVFSVKIGSTVNIADLNWKKIIPKMKISLNDKAVGYTYISSVPKSFYSTRSGEVAVYNSGVVKGVPNPDRMIVKYSADQQDYGIGYSDNEDTIDFIGNGNKNVRINLGQGNIQTEGNLNVEGEIKINSTTSHPEPNTLYGNSLPIAYGKIGSGGDILSGYGIKSVTYVSEFDENDDRYYYIIEIDSEVPRRTTLVPIITTLRAGVPTFAQYNTNDEILIVTIYTHEGRKISGSFSFVVFKGLE